jgi:ketosteroid isomerase-like protein
VVLGRRRRLYDAQMSLGKQDVRKLIDIYIRAWTTQDPELILTVFTPTATYHERVLQEPIRDHAGIREYWQTKVVQEQANIQAELLNLYTDGATAIAEWEARFDDVVDGHRKRMREVAILELDGDRVASLREYWTSERVSS